MVRKGKPMERVRIKDNAFISRDELAPVSNLTEKIVDKTLSRLEREGIFVFPETERDTKDLTFDQMILRRADGGYRSGNVMGMLGLGDERLLIASRFDGEDDFFFQYLVERVMDFRFFRSGKRMRKGSGKSLISGRFFFPVFSRRPCGKAFSRRIRRKITMTETSKGPSMWLRMSKRIRRLREISHTGGENFCATMF